MYKQYITTGMSKKKNWLFMLLWLLVAATSRIQYFIFGGQTFTDTYAYFSYAIMHVQKQEPVLNSGLSYAFTKNLSRLLFFTGNLIDAVGVYQLVIQILWMMLLLTGISMLIGKIAGFVTSGILIVSPWILKSVFSVSPENYFMLYLSLLLLALGYFHDKSVKGKWHKSVWSKFYLKAVGFFSGIICVWNYLGWIVPILTVYALIFHSVVLKDRLKQQKQDKELKEKKRIMGTGSQLFHLLCGWIIGIYIQFMRYTGLTGNNIKEQLDWWLTQFKVFPERCQDVSTVFSVWFLGALLAGVLCQLIFYAVKPKKTKDMEAEKDAGEAQSVVESVQDAGETQGAEHVQEEVSEVQAEQESEIYQKPPQELAESTKKVKFLENPLPVPKKHVKKDMGFDLEDCKMGFDIEIDKNDDFDI